MVAAASSLGGAARREPGGRRGCDGSPWGAAGRPACAIHTSAQRLHQEAEHILERLNLERVGGVVVVVAGRRFCDASGAGKTRPGLQWLAPRGALCLFSRARGAISRAEASQDTALFTRKRATALRAVRAPYLGQGQEGASAAAHAQIARDDEQPWSSSAGEAPQRWASRTSRSCRAKRWKAPYENGSSSASTGKPGRGESALRMIPKNSRPSRASGGTSLPR